MTANPNREFSVDKTEGESPLQVSFDASNIKPAKKFVWSFGNGETLTTTNSSVIYSYSSTGTYTANLKYVINASEKNPNYKDAGSVLIVVKKKPNQSPMAFLSCSTSNLLLNCNALASFDPEGQPLQFEFDYGDGVVEQSSNGVVSHSYVEAGLYQVNLKVKDSLGAISIATTQVQAVKPPNVLPRIQLACTSTKPQQMDCSANGTTDSDGTIASYQYSFDDGFVSNESSASHVYTTDGTHSVTLKVIDNDGGEVSTSASVVLKQNAAPAFDLFASSVTGVAPLTVNFETRNAVDSDGTITSYEWTFSDGGIATAANATHVFNNVGTFNAILKVTDNLGATTIKSIAITTLEPLKTPPTAYFKYYQGEDLGTYLTLNASGMKTQFDIKRAYYTIDNSRTIELTEFLPNTISTVEMGSYGAHTITITVIDVRDQVSTFTHQINLKTDHSQILPFVGFRGTQSGPKTVFFNFNQSFTQDYGEEIDFFRVDYGDGRIEDVHDYYSTHVYVNAGTYNVRATAFTTTGTRATAVRTVPVTNDQVPVIQPVAAFTYKIYSFAQNISFYDERSGSPNGGIISYFWEFGDGETGTGKDIVHFYNPGSYFVKLTVTDFAGYTSSQTQHITISGQSSDLVANMWCESNYITADCYAVALDKFEQINHVQFNWGDQQSSLGELVDPSKGIYHAQHVYGNDGNYSVVVNVGTERGEFKNVSSLVSLVNNAPMVGGVKCDLYYREVYCYPLNSSDPEGGALTYEFNFGDGVIESTSDGLGHHFYNGPGNFIVTMKASDPLGKSVTVQTGVSNVNHLPVLGEVKCDVYGMEVYCYPTQAYDPDGGTLAFEFNYGDGNVESNSEGLGRHVYSQYGNYVISLKVTDPLEATAVANTSVNLINLVPVAAINCFVNNLLVHCNSAGSFDPEGGNLRFKFDFGDGFVEENEFGYVTHAYANAGLRNVILLVTDDVGQAVGVSTQVMPVLPPNQLPIAMFNCESPRPNTINCFDTGSVDDDGTIVSRKLSFDDGAYEFLNPPDGRVHQFESAGEHTVTYAVLDNDGGVSEVSRKLNVRVNTNPIADFECSTPGPQRLNCYSTSTDPDQGDFVSTFEWEFGDGQKLNGLQGYFDHTYGEDPFVTVNLTVHDQYGGRATISKNISMIANQAPIANINCFTTTGNTYQCNANSYDPDGQIVSQVWTIDGVNLSGNSVVYNFMNGGNHPIKLSMTDELGKTAIATTIVNIEMPVASLVCSNITNYKIHCDGSGSVGLSNSGNLAYTIMFDDDYVTNASMKDYEFQSSGDKLIKLIVTDELGNKSESETIIKILPTYTLPVPYFSENVNLGRIVDFDASNSLFQDRTIIRYEWDFGDGSKVSSTQPKVNHAFQDYNYYVVTLKVTDEKNNQSTFSKKIYIYDPVVADPSEQGRNDLLGIDSDNDGIRDDIQRWIQLESKDNSNLKKYLKAIAHIYEENFRNISSLENINNNFSKLNNVQQCLSLEETDLDRIDLLKRLFKIGYGNTDTRFLAINKIDGSFTGQTVDPPMNDSDLRIFCEALPWKK